MENHGPERRRIKLQFGLSSMFVVTTLTALVSACFKVFGVDLLSAFVLAPILIAYWIVYVTAPLFVFITVCLSSRLTLQRLAIVGSITSVLVVSPLLVLAMRERNPLAAIVVLVLSTAVLWLVQIVFVGGIYVIYRRNKRRDANRPRALPSQLGFASDTEIREDS